MEFTKNILILIVTTCVSIVLILFVTVFIEINSLKNAIDIGVNKRIDIIVNENKDNIQQLQDDIGMLNVSFHAESEQLRKRIKKTGCTLVGNRCFTIHVARIYGWSAGKNHCENSDGFMAEFSGRDVDFNDVKQKFPQIKGGYDAWLWINGHFEADGIWKWGRSGSLIPLSHPSWLKKNSTSNSRDFNCLLLQYDSNGEIVMLDFPCTFNNGVICEYEV